MNNTSTAFITINWCYINICKQMFVNNLINWTQQTMNNEIIVIIT